MNPAFHRTLLLALITLTLFGCSSKSTTAPLPTNPIAPSTQNDLQSTQTATTTTQQPSTPEVTNPFNDQALRIELIDNAEGFTLQPYDLANIISKARYFQTLQSPNQDAILHILTREEARDFNEPNPFWQRTDLIVVQPANKLVQSYILWNGYTSDISSTASITNVIGFLDNEHIIYVALNDEPAGTTSYRIEKMNIFNGNKTILFDQQPAHIAPDFYVAGWLTKDKDKLVISSYSEGKVQIYDLNQNTVFTMDQHFPNPWPKFSIMRSPDGLQFWSDGHLYTLDGKQTKIPSLPGPISLDILWSPDSQYAARHYAKDDSPEHQLSGGESDILVPQGIQIVNQVGKLILEVKPEQINQHVEVVGWLVEPQIAIVQQYEIGEANGAHIRTQSSYHAVNMLTGSKSRLSAVGLDKLNTLSRVNVWSPFTGEYGIPMYVDMENKTYWRTASDNYSQVYNSENHSIWNEWDAESGQTRAYNLSTSSKKLTELSVGSSESYSRLFQNGWLIDGSSLSYTKVE